MKKVYVTIGLLFDDNKTYDEISKTLENTDYVFTDIATNEEIQTDTFDYDLSNIIIV